MDFEIALKIEKLCRNMLKMKNCSLSGVSLGEYVKSAGKGLYPVLGIEPAPAEKGVEAAFGRVACRVGVCHTNRHLF